MSTEEEYWSSPSLSCVCLCLSLTEANVCSVVSKGYISGLLRLYEDWHSKGAPHAAIAIRHALLRCLHKVTHSTAGRQAFVSHGGIRLLYETTQVKFRFPDCFFLSVLFPVSLPSPHCTDLLMGPNISLSPSTESHTVNWFTWLLHAYAVVKISFASLCSARAPPYVHTEVFILKTHQYYCHPKMKFDGRLLAHSFPVSTVLYFSIDRYINWVLIIFLFLCRRVCWVKVWSLWWSSLCSWWGSVFLKPLFHWHQISPRTPSPCLEDHALCLIWMRNQVQYQYSPHVNVQQKHPLITVTDSDQWSCKICKIIVNNHNKPNKCNIQCNTFNLGIF